MSKRSWSNSDFLPFLGTGQKPPPRHPRSLVDNDAVNVKFDLVINKEKCEEATLILGIVNKAAVPIANVAVAFSHAHGAVSLVLTLFSSSSHFAFYSLFHSTILQFLFSFLEFFVLPCLIPAASQIMKGTPVETVTVSLNGLAITPNVAPHLVKQTLAITGPITAVSTIKGTLSFTPDGADIGMVPMRIFSLPLGFLSSPSVSSFSLSSSFH